MDDQDTQITYREDVKGILYLDGDEENGLIDSYVTAAEAFVRNSIGTSSDDFYNDKGVKPLVTLAIESLAATYYQNRLALSDTQTHPIDLTVNSVIGQLRGMKNKFEEDEQSESTDKPVQPSN